MNEIHVNSNQELLENSNIIEVIPNKKYSITTKVACLKCKPFSAYFGVIDLDENNKEIDRKIIWLHEFTDTEQYVSLTFTSSTNKILILYRVNVETPIKNDCIFRLLPINDICVSKVSQETKENFVYLRDCVLPKSDELSNEQEDNLERNLVWLFGFGRGGTTWLGTQLLTYQTYIMQEPYITNHLGFDVGDITEDIVRHVDLSDMNPDYFFSKRYQETWKFFLRKLILNRIAAQFPIDSKKIILKEPLKVGAPDIISDCMKNSKIIILVRDGRDVVSSLVDSRSNDKSWGVKGKFSSKINPALRSEIISRYAKVWVKGIDTLMNVYNKHSEKNRMIIKYEELRKDTFKELKKIYGFLNIKIEKKELESLIEKYSFERIPKELIGKGKFTRFATPGRWKKDFTENEKILLNSIMSHQLKKFSYK